VLGLGDALIAVALLDRELLLLFVVGVSRLIDGIVRRRGSGLLAVLLLVVASWMRFVGKLLLAPAVGRLLAMRDVSLAAAASMRRLPIPLWTSATLTAAGIPPAAPTTAPAFASSGIEWRGNDE
jgi:hypothetical protein